MNVDPSLVAILVAVSVAVAMVAGAFAASLIIEATKDGIDTELL